MQLYFRNTDPSFDLLFPSEEEAQSYIDQYKAAVVGPNDTIVAERSSFTPQPQASMTIIDQRTGYVKAIVGGRGEKTASLTLNRATDTYRQPGSTFKILSTYGPAMDLGRITLATVITDEPYNYSDGSPVHNSDNAYHGDVTIRTAIQNSFNIVAVKVLTEITPQTGFDYLLRLGFSELINDTNWDVIQPLALGGITNGVSNLELTAAYAAIANGGVYIEPIFYTKVLDRDGNVLLENTPVETRVFKESTAYLLTSAMEDVLTSGTGTRAWFSGMDLAGKSGTTTDLRDLWFVGYSPYSACGVWGGYDDFSAQSSSAYVTNIWKAVMQRAHQGLSRRDFTGTEELTPCTICTKCGALAVEDLCDSTVQGDMTYREYFVPGTEPTEACTCHVAVEVCQDSGQIAGTYCPADRVERSVYLQSGTAGTADAEAVVPEELGEETCQVHQHWWSWLFPEGGQDPQTPEEPTPEERPNGSRPGWGGWFTWW